MRAALCVLLLAPSGAQAQDMRFDIAATEVCLAQATPETGSQCAGRAADVCMMANPGGQSTYGMSFCLDAEWTWWDSGLNATFQALMALEKAEDARMTAVGAFAPSLADALRGMQRAWIAWRDARCAYAAAQWAGGTGAGPAVIGCLLEETARQALVLQTREQEARSR